MGILSEEKYAEFVGKLEGQDDAPAPEAPAEEPAVEAQETQSDSSSDSEDVKPVEDGPSDDTEDVKEEVETQAESSESDVPRTPENIPYSRFKEVNDKFRSRESDLEQARTRIQELEKLTLAQAQQPKSPEEPQQSESDAWLNEVFGEDVGDKSAKAIGELREQLQSMQTWQQQRTEQVVGAQLETEIQAAVEKNPDVKADELWHAVANDGTVDVEQYATAVQEHRATLREQYKTEAHTETEQLKAKLAEAEKAAEEGKKFRRPGASVSTPTPKTVPTGSISDASDAFAEALRERMSF